jgi:microcin C transport system substrate-binding protein
MMRCHRKLFLLSLIATLLTVGCSSSAPPAGNPSDIPAEAPTNVSMNKDDYPVFVDPDAGADPSVPAELGGKGFTGEGWETNTSYDLLSDPRAVKGGQFVQATSSFPATFRYTGVNGSTVTNYVINSLVYETLLELNPTTLESMPALATHWQILPDKMTFRFRIDPNARWSDGQPVVAEDVVATWKLETDKNIQDPFHNALYGEFEQPVAESKYIVRVKSKQPKWLNFLQFSQSMMIYPAHILKNVDGAAFIRDWNFKMMPGSGPYVVNESDIEKGKSFTLRRRPDYWGAKIRRNVGKFNFDQLRFVIVRDDNLEYEMVKRGDLDNFIVSRAQMWVQELEYDTIQRGLLQKRKVYNHQPQAIGGFAFNTRREPFNDIRVRKALYYLFNRDLMLEKMMFSQYEPMNSHFPGSIYENPNNEKVHYNPQKAVQLLAEAGWKDRDSQGRLTKNGKPLTLELLHYAPTYGRFFTVFQEDLRKVGIALNLREVTAETAFQLKDQQKFDMICMFYGGGSPWPVPRQFYHSSQDVIGGDNLTGFRSPKLDELVEQYDREFDLQKRIALMRELDTIVSAESHWILLWHSNYSRYLYWNKFGQPPGYTSRILEREVYDPIVYWWVDPAKARRLEEARRDSSIKLDVGASEVKYWLDYAKLEEQAAPAKQ